MIIKGEKIGCSSDFWNNYKQDIKLAADLGEDSACCLLRSEVNSHVSECQKWS